MADWSGCSLAYVRTNEPFESLRLSSRGTILTGYEPNAFGEDKGASGSSAGTSAHAPKLRGGAPHYAAWKRDMTVWLERYGAHGVHTRVIDAKQWKHYAEQVQQWGEEELQEAMLAFSPSAPALRAKLSDEEKAVAEAAKASGDGSDQARLRKALTTMVQNSIRVYGVCWTRSVQCYNRTQEYA